MIDGGLWSRNLAEHQRLPMKKEVEECSQPITLSGS